VKQADIPSGLEGGEFGINLFRLTAP